MKKFIKIIALSLTVAMLAVGLVACSGGAAQDEEGEWGDFSWSYKKDTKTLTVTGAGDIYKLYESILEDVVIYLAISSKALLTCLTYPFIFLARMVTEEATLVLLSAIHCLQLARGPPRISW